MTANDLYLEISDIYLKRTQQNKNFVAFEVKM